MDNIIEFPSGESGSEAQTEGENEVPSSIEIPATAARMPGIILGRILELQASVHATASLIADVLMELDESEDKIAVQQEVLVDYEGTRREILKRLIRQLQEQFPLIRS